MSVFTKEEIESEIGQFIDRKWNDVAYDMIMSVAENPNPDYPDAYTAKDYKNAVSGFKDYILDRIGDEYGDEIFNECEKEIRKLVKSFQG